MPVNNAPVTPFENETPVNNAPAPETQTTPEQEKNNSDSNEETLRQNFKRQFLEVTNGDEGYAEAVSHAFIAGNKYFAKYSDNTLEDIINADNLKFEAQEHIFIRDKNGQIVFDNHNKPKEAKAQTKFNELGALIRVSRLADKSSIMHELEHLFLHKFQALSKAGKLSGIAKQDFETLLKTYRVSDLDTATHERFCN